MELTEYTTPGGTIFIGCDKHPEINIRVDAEYVYYETEKTTLRLADNASLDEARAIALDVFSAISPVNRARAIAKETKGK